MGFVSSGALEPVGSRWPEFPERRWSEFPEPAVAESFFATLEWELIMQRDWQTRAEARRDIFEFIEGWYNRERRHSTLGYRSPITYEREVIHAAA